MTDKKPVGYFEKLLVVDSETTGGHFRGDDPSYNPTTGETYQAISWGLIVVNAQTLKTVDELYVEIKWDGVSVWDKKAQAVHGLSPAHLEEHGIDSSDAVVEIAGLILKHWGPESPVCLAGHNVATFDVWFLKRLLRSEGIEVRFSNRMVDTNTLGFAVFTAFNSNELFEQIGCPTRDASKHNALDDARQSLQVIRTVRTLFKHCIDGD